MPFAVVVVTFVVTSFVAVAFVAVAFAEAVSLVVVTSVPFADAIVDLLSEVVTLVAK